MEPFYLILSFDKETETWNPGMFLYKTEEEAEQSLYKLTNYHHVPGKYKLIKITHYETLEEVEEPD